MIAPTTVGLLRIGGQCFGLLNQLTVARSYLAMPLLARTQGDPQAGRCGRMWPLHLLSVGKRGLRNRRGGLAGYSHAAFRWMSNASPPPPAAVQDRDMFSKSLMLLCASMFLAYAGQAILTPIIPIYVSKLGGSTSVAGFALLAFAAPSFLVRPILGPMADRVGHAVMLTFGVIGLALSGLAFFIPSLIALFIGSAARGLAWGALNIGGYAHLATAAPPDRRGEATGYFYSAITGAFVVFPALGLWLMNGGGGPVAVFATSFAVTAVAIPIALMMRRRELADRRAAPPEPETASAPANASALNRGIVIAMVLSLCQTLPAPAIAAFLPLFAQKEGLGDVSIYYIVSGILIVLMRFVLGKRADTLGQGTLIAVGFVAQTIGLIMIWRGHTLPIVLVGAIIASIGPGLIGAATTTLAMDAAPPERRGQAMAIFTMTFQIGAGLGSVFSGMLADLLGVRDMYLGSLAISLIGTIFLVAVWKTMPRPAR